MSHQDVTRVTTESVEGWISGLLERGVGAATAHASLLIVRQTLDAAMEVGVIRSNPARGIQVPGVAAIRQPEESEILTEEQLQAILEYVDPHFKAMVLFAARTGARWDEVLGLRVEDLFLDDGLVRVGAVRVADSSHEQKLYLTGNPADIRLIPLTDDLVVALREYLDLTADWRTDDWNWVFLSSRSHNHPVGPNFHKYVMRPALKAAGFDERAYTFHSLRHTAAVAFIREGYDMSRVQRLMGHKQKESTRRTYYRYFAEKGTLDT
jgi:integrase